MIGVYLSKMGAKFLLSNLETEKFQVNHIQPTVVHFQSQKVKL